MFIGRYRIHLLWQGFDADLTTLVPNFPLLNHHRGWSSWDVEELEQLVIKQQICQNMAHSLCSFIWFLGINHTEIPRITLSYTPKIKTRMRLEDFADRTTSSLAVSQKFLCIASEGHKPLKTERIFWPILIIF